MKKRSIPVTYRVLRFFCDPIGAKKRIWLAMDGIAAVFYPLSWSCRWSERAGWMAEISWTR